MAQIYKFFNSTDTDRRTYQAGDFADYFGSVLSTGLIHTDNEAGMETFVEGGTLRTYVTPGKAIMQGHLYENTTDEYLEHSLPESTADRIDRIVLRLDLRNSERNILLHIKEGDPNSNPVAPSLQRDNFIYELSLAQIRVRANTSSLDASDLVDERLDEDLCGLVNSMLTVPTSQFLSEWNSFMDTIRDQSPASQGDLDNLRAEIVQHADYRLESNQSIPHGYNHTKVMLNNVFSDADFVNLENGGVRVLKDGLYLISFHVYFAHDSSGRRGLSFNGAPSVIVEPVSQTDGQTRTFLTGFNYYEKDDIIDFTVEQSSGNSLNVMGSNVTRVLISKLG